MSKKLIYLFAFLGSVVLFTPSCGDTDACKDVDCGANGTCFEGVCICDVGYEQDANGQCSQLVVTKFLGSYAVSESCTGSGSASYNVSITSGSGLSDVNITNFWDLFQNVVKATVDGNTITVARQEPDSDGFFVEGSGTITVGTPTVINWNYTISDENVPSSGTASCANVSFTRL